MKFDRHSLLRLPKALLRCSKQGQVRAWATISLSFRNVRRYSWEAAHRIVPSGETVCGEEFSGSGVHSQDVVNDGEESKVAVRGLRATIEGLSIQHAIGRLQPSW